MTGTHDPLAAGLPLTGERTVPGIPEENYWFRRHEVAYLWAAPLVAGHRVLEVGAGEGYGSALLAGTAGRVVAVDYDAAAAAHAARRYPQVTVARANLAALPVRDGAVDTVVTFQVIEHVWDHRQFLTECLRVLRPGGTALVTTPNRLTFSPGDDGRGRPLNPFHTHEFTATELTRLLVSCGFAVEVVGGLHAGPRLAALDHAHGGSFSGAQLECEPPRWSPGLRADVASVRAADFVVRTERADVDRSLDLLIIARRPVA